MKIIKLVSNLRNLTFKKKVVFMCSLAGVFLVSGVAVYGVTTESKEVVLAEDVEVDKVDTDTTLDEQEVNSEDVEQVEEEPVEENTEVTSDNTIDEESTSENNESVATETEESESATYNSEPSTTEETVVPATTLTYTSPYLGISFDMPSSWTDKYTIQDDGTTIFIYMKVNDPSTGDGLLAIITTDFKEYDNGSCIDTIQGVEKNQTINGTQFLVGGPTDFRIEPTESNTADVEQYKTMCSEVSQVLQSLG